MFSWRINHFFGFKSLECTNHTETGITRFNDIIDITVRSCLIGIREFLFVFVYLFAYESCFFFKISKLRDCTSSNTSIAPAAPITAISAVWPCVVEVATKLFTTHYVVCTTI